MTDNPKKDSRISRRGFIKKGAAAGIGAGALTTLTENKAYWLPVRISESEVESQQS